MRRTTAVAALAAGAATITLAASEVAARRLRRRAGTLTGPAPSAVEGYAVGANDRLIWWRSVEPTDGATQPTLLLVHGITLDGDVWNEIVPDLVAAGHRVVVIDQRGHGRSSTGADRLTMSAGMGADLAAVIEQLDLRDTVVVGHSMGGMATQQLLVDRPGLCAERLRGAVLLSTAPGRLAANALPSERGTVGLQQFERRIAPAFGQLRFQGPAKPGLGLLAIRLVFGSNAPPEAVVATHRYVLDTPASGVRQAVWAIAHFDVLGALGTIGTPVMVVNGTHDTLTPVFGARRSAAAIPGARLEIVHRGGHMLMYETPDLLVALLRDYTASLPAVTPPERSDVGDVFAPRTPQIG